MPSRTRSRIETTKRLLQTLREQRVAKFRQTATELEVEFLPPAPEPMKHLAPTEASPYERTLQAITDLTRRHPLE